MKKFIFIILIFFVTKNTMAQVDLAAGMGISFVNNSSLNDYLEYNWSAEEIPSFSSTAEFYFEVDYSLTPSFQLGIEDSSGRESIVTCGYGISMPSSSKRFLILLKNSRLTAQR